MTDQPVQITGSMDFANASFVNARLAGGTPEPTITPEQCVAAGGHCHVRTGYSRASYPPQYAEKCKHCGNVRWAIPRGSYEYRDENGEIIS